jgi:hypothetical protein
MGALGGVQSTAGGAACVRTVFSEGAATKSNMSSSGWAYSSRRVRCWVMPPDERNRFSIRASKEVWSPMTGET